MIQYSSTETFDSQSQPGARYTLRKMSVNRRRAYNEQMAAHLAKLRDIQDEQQVLDDEWQQALDRAKIAPCSCAHPPERHDKESGRCMELGCRCRKPDFPAEKQRRIQDLLIDTLRIKFERLQPTAIRWGLVSIEGIEVDGKPPDVDWLFEAGPDELVREIADRIDGMLGLSVEQGKNSESPTTSGGPVDGQTTDSGAPSASDANSIAIVIAESISPNP